MKADEKYHLMKTVHLKAFGVTKHNKTAAEHMPRKHNSHKQNIIIYIKNFLFIFKKNI